MRAFLPETKLIDPDRPFDKEIPDEPYCVVYFGKPCVIETSDFQGGNILKMSTHPDVYLGSLDSVAALHQSTSAYWWNNKREAALALLANGPLLKEKVVFEREYAVNDLGIEQEKYHYEQFNECGMIASNRQLREELERRKELKEGPMILTSSKAKIDPKDWEPRVYNGVI